MKDKKISQVLRIFEIELGPGKSRKRHNELHKKYQKKRKLDMKRLKMFGPPDVRKIT